MARQSVYKRVRHAVDKRKYKIILDYMKDNWDVVLNSSVTMMKGLDFPPRIEYIINIRKKFRTFGWNEISIVNRSSPPRRLLREGRCMGRERQIKNMRRTVRKEQNKLIMRYIKENATAVIGASISMMRTFKFRNRLFIALKILFVSRRGKAEAAASPAGE
ncbi:MAG: hypothetical protein LBQ88_16885 [Treponema sp.]|jgi:hypothetical protein|nr:hypothetical protein [Treponema sp.]